MDPLELPDQRGGAILNPEEVKEIFYPLPQLAALHQNMLVGHSMHMHLTACCRTHCIPCFMYGTFVFNYGLYEFPYSVAFGTL